MKAGWLALTLSMASGGEKITDKANKQKTRIQQQKFNQEQFES